MQITDTAEVAAALESFVALLEDPDPQARAFIYTEDATFAMPGILVEGRRAMLERLSPARFSSRSLSRRT